MSDFNLLFTGAAFGDMYSPGSVQSMLVGGTSYMLAALAFAPWLRRLPFFHGGFALGYGAIRFFGYPPRTATIAALGLAYFGFTFDVAINLPGRIRPFRLGTEERFLIPPGRYVRLKRFDPNDLNKEP